MEKAKSLKEISELYCEKSSVDDFKVGERWIAWADIEAFARKRIKKLEKHNHAGSIQNYMCKYCEKIQAIKQFVWGD